MIVNEKTLRDLEFDRLRAVVREHASTSLGEKAIDDLIPVTDPDAVERAIAEVEEAMRLLRLEGGFRLGAVSDLAPLLSRGREGGHLGGEEFSTVLQTIEATEEVRSRLTAISGYPMLTEYAERLTSGGREIGVRIRRTIDERGDVRDDATPELASLIKRRRIMEDRVDAKLRSYMARNPDLIGESVITRRRGRLVIPIRSGATGAAAFVVHDRSATGQTLYAEPTSVVSENNALAEHDEAVRTEIRRILHELTMAVLDAEAAFLRDRMVLSHLDSLFARAEYARTARAEFPKRTQRIRLRDVRHPLLPREDAVPVSLTLGDGPRMLVITGPNTGGKTVTLKTVGLLVLMTQAGIPIPASPDSETMIVGQVRTDIGDEQSIEQSLSTFSAHMNNIIRVLDEATDDSLILLDELGAGTDPQEGAALGLAVIEALLEAGALVGISTHLTPLKYFAIRHPEIKTASMEFDLKTLSPTYRVVEGLPGKSNAFLIARRLGLPEELISRAQGFLSQGEIRAEDIIDELQRERQALLRQRDSAFAETRRARKLREDYEEKLAAFERDKETGLSKEIRSLDGFLRDGQQRLEELLAVANRGNRPVEETREALHEVSDLRQELAERKRASEAQAKGQPLADGEIEEGSVVYVGSVGSDGRILQTGPGDRVTVDVGGIRVTTTVRELARPRGTQRSEPAQPRRSKQRMSRPRRVPLQLDVRGMTVNEALREVEAYMDQLLRADIRQASILHGKGTGALRDAVRAYLGSCAFVCDFGYSPPNMGGEGVSQFELAGDAPD